MSRRTNPVAGGMAPLQYVEESALPVGSRKEQDRAVTTDSGSPLYLKKHLGRGVSLSLKRSSAACRLKLSKFIIFISQSQQIGPDVEWSLDFGTKWRKFYLSLPAS